MAFKGPGPSCGRPAASAGSRCSLAAAAVASNVVGLAPRMVLPTVMAAVATSSEPSIGIHRDQCVGKDDSLAAPMTSGTQRPNVAAHSKSVVWCAWKPATHGSRTQNAADSTAPRIAGGGGGHLKKLQAPPPLLQPRHSHGSTRSDEAAVASPMRMQAVRGTQRSKAVGPVAEPRLIRACARSKTKSVAGVATVATHETTSASSHKPEPINHWI